VYNELVFEDVQVVLSGIDKGIGKGIEGLAEGLARV
jgi:hypothetical protein